VSAGEVRSAPGFQNLAAEFQICEVCGEEIDIERLKLRPVTELCIGCKIYQEKLEKLACE
jgi:RNA polymerase-binding transcription factor DksA